MWNTGWHIFSLFTSCTFQIIQHQWYKYCKLFSEARQRRADCDLDCSSISCENKSFFSSCHLLILLSFAQSFCFFLLIDVPIGNISLFSDSPMLQPFYFIYSHQNYTNLLTICLTSVSVYEQQLEGDLETLALVMYSSLCVSMLALLLTVLVLSCLRGLKSNTRSIHSNTAAAMFLSELVFLSGVNQTEQQVQ